MPTAHAHVSAISSAARSRSTSRVSSPIQSTSNTSSSVPAPPAAGTGHEGLGRSQPARSESILTPMAEQTAQKSMTIPLVAFTAGAVVALLVGVFGKVHTPTLDGTTTLGFRSVIDMKVAVTTVVGALALLQLLGALGMYGKLGHRMPSWLGTAHRVTGTIALVLAAFVAYHCLWALGLETGTLQDGESVPMRTVVHGVAGCLVIGAVVVKVTAVQSRRAPGWFLPLAGGL